MMSMRRILLIVLSGSAYLSTLSAIMLPIVFGYQAEYDSRWQIYSGSMFPTLELLDIVYVKNVSGQVEVYAAYDDGDIILFHKPVYSGELIIHRAVEKFQSDSVWYFKTKGDNNPSVDPWNVPEDHVIGEILALSRIHQIKSQNVTIFSNSVYSNFYFNSSANAVELSVGAYLVQSTPNSFFNVTIPNDFVTGELDVLVDDLSIPFTHSTNGTHYFAWFDWEGTNYTIGIVLPEFPALIILPLFMTVTLAAVLAYKKRPR